MTNLQNTRVFTVTEPERLDKFLTNRMPDFSRSRIQGLIHDGYVKIGAEIGYKSSCILTIGEQVTILIPVATPIVLEPEVIQLDIIFENKDLMVINKPAGMVVHPAPGHSSGTLVNAALSHAADLEGIGGEIRPGIVHRLDKDTSGLIMIAKNERSHRWLQDQFRSRQVKKTYLALVEGSPPTDNGKIEASIGRDLHHRKQMAIVSDAKGREAVSEYCVIEKFLGFTMVEVHPVTGRTHQIRLHMAFLGCPIAGDAVYGRRIKTLGLTRQFLHSARLSVILPGETKPQIFDAPLPQDLAVVLDYLRSKK